MQTTAIKTRDAAAAPIRVTSEDDIAVIKKNMKAFTVFATLAEAIAAIQKVSDATDDFKGIPVYLKGVTVENGKYVPEKDGEAFYQGNAPVFAYVAGSARGEAGKSIKTILLFPIPTLDTVLNGGDSATGWLAKIASKEFRHVYFRGYRDADSWNELDEGFATSPTDLESFLASHARGAGEELDTDAFDAVWPDFRKNLTKSQPALAKVLPPKGEIIKAIRSESYAQQMHGDLEKRNVFIAIAASVVTIGEAQKPTPVDMSTVKAWYAERKTTKIDAKVVTADDLAALDSVMAGMDMGGAAAALGIAS